MRKIFTALITIVSILILVGLTMTAFATQVPSILTAEQARICTINQKAAYEGMTQVAAITGQTSVAPEQVTMASEFTVAKTIVASNSDTAKMADQMTQGSITKKTEQSEANTTLISTMAVAETAPRYADLEGTIPRVTTGRFTGAASITGSEMAVKIGKKTPGGVFVLV